MVNPTVFLEKHQPLPMDVSAELQAEFVEILLVLREKEAQTEQVVPLLLNCWNDWEDGHHQEAIIATLARFPPEWVGPHLAFGLCDQNTRRRLWFAEVAKTIPWHSCIPGLLKMLAAEDDLERFVAACALEVYDDPEIREHAARQLAVEHDEETIEVLEAILEKA